MSNTNKTLFLAQRMSTIQEEIAAFETQLKTVKEELLLLHPEIEEGVSPPFFSVSIAERVEVTDAAKAAAFFMKNKALQPFFKLSIGKDAFTKLGAPAWASLKQNAPSIRVNQKQLAAELDARRGFTAEADNPVNALSA